MGFLNNAGMSGLIKRSIDNVSFVLAPSKLYQLGVVNDSNEKRNEKSDILHAFYRGRFVDSSNSLDLGLKFNQYREPWERDIITDDFIDIATRRAKTIEKIDSVLWSGGIDSTFVLLILLKYQTNNIKVVYEKSALAEHPWLNDHIINHPRTIMVEVSNPFDYIASNVDVERITTGEMGGELFGSPMAFEDLLEKDAKEAMLSNVPLATLPDEVRNIILPLLDFKPDHIKTNYDMTWFQMYMMKFQFIRWRIHLHSGTLSKNLDHFFVTDKFESWAMSNTIDVKMPTFEFSSFKQIMKDFIRDELNDVRANDMIKHFSMPTAVPSLGDRNNPLRKRSIVRLDDGTYELQELINNVV